MDKIAQLALGKLPETTISGEMQTANSSNLSNKIKERVYVIFGENYRVRRINDLQTRLKYTDYFCLFVSVVGAILAVSALETSLTFTGDGVNIPDLTILQPVFSPLDVVVCRLRVAVSIFTILLLIGIIRHYRILLKLDKMKMYLRPEDTLWSSGYYKYMIGELLLSIVHTPYGVTTTVQIAQRLPGLPPADVNIDVILLTCLLFGRFYHVVRFTALHIKINNYEYEKLCLECRTPMNFLFCIKILFNRNPFLLVGSMLAISIFVFGYTLRCVEMFFINSSNQDWRWYWNGMWCIIVTMSTVGFGDFFPISLMGRAISVIAALWGNFLISLMVSALTVWIEFNPQEASAYEAIKSINAETEYGQLGTLFLQNMRRYNLFLQKTKMMDPAYLQTNEFKQEKSRRFTRLREVTENFRVNRKEKNIKIEGMLIEVALSQMDININAELDKIKFQTLIFPEIRDLLATYNKNQDYIQKLTVELYKDLEEMNIFRQKYMKKL